MPTAATLDMDQLTELVDLAGSSHSIELKVTVPDHSTRSVVRTLGLDPLDAQIRQVFFLDTPELTLEAAGVVVRARRVQGREHDSVVKLRPVVPSELPEELMRLKSFVVELDAMPGGYVCSASMKGRIPPDVIMRSISGARPLHKIFSQRQLAFYKEHAPPAVDFDQLSVLGPVFVLKLKTVPSGLSRKIVTELWLYPDGSRIVELSTKCLPGEGLRTAVELRRYFDERGLDLSGEQRTKTRTALEFFARELQGSGNGSVSQGNGDAKRSTKRTVGQRAVS